MIDEVGSVISIDRVGRVSVVVLISGCWICIGKDAVFVGGGGKTDVVVVVVVGTICIRGIIGLACVCNLLRSDC